MKRGLQNPILNLAKSVHKEYKSDLHNNISQFKEYRLPSGKRIDYIDFDSKTIYELKPHNPKQIAKGKKQLNEYLKEVEELYGPGWKTVLDTY